MEKGERIIMKIILSKDEYNEIVNTALFQKFGATLGLSSKEPMQVEVDNYQFKDYCTISIKEGGD